MSTVFSEGVGEKLLVEMFDQFVDAQLICQVVNKRDPNSDRLVVELFSMNNGYYYMSFIITLRLKSATVSMII